MPTQRILLPYNFAAHDQKALRFVVHTFARSEDAEVTLFHAYTPTPEFDPRESQVMEKLKGNVNYLSQRIGELEAALEEARKELLEGGFREQRVRSIFKPKTKDIASEIVDLVLDEQFNIVVINRKPGRVTRFFTQSVANKVVGTLRGATVCIVS
jgi:hypothetical protein